MLNWGLRDLLHQPGRPLSGAVAVAAAFLLVLFFDAVFEGESRRIVAYPSHAGADVWVMQKGVSNMHMASSLLWDWKLDRVARVPGVAAVEPILYLNTVVSAGGREWFTYVVGVDRDARRAGPWAMASGRRLPGPGEVVVPEVLARIAGLGPGDQVTLLGRALRIVGLSRGTFSMANSVTFVARADLAELMNVRDAVSYLLVSARPGVSPAELAQRIESEVDKVSALPAAIFVARDREMAMQMGTEVIRIMTLVGALLAVLVVAFTAWRQVVRRSRELAVARALGFGAAALYGVVILQTSLITLAGVLLAAAGGWWLLPWVPQIMPQISLLVDGSMLLWLAGVGLPVAVLSSLWPARAVMRVDPLEAFQR